MCGNSHDYTNYCKGKHAAILPPSNVDIARDIADEEEYSMQSSTSDMLLQVGWLYLYKRVVERLSPMQKASGVLIEEQSMVMMALSKGETQPTAVA